MNNKSDQITYSTDIIITCLDTDFEMQEFFDKTGVMFKESKTSQECFVEDESLSSYIFVSENLSSSVISNLITEFKCIDFVLPEFASLTVCCDSFDNLDGVYRPDNLSINTKQGVGYLFDSTVNFLLSLIGVVVFLGTAYLLWKI